MTIDLTPAFRYLDGLGVEIPADLHRRARELGAVKTGDLAAINARYHDEITRRLLAYFEGGTIVAPRNRFRTATTEAFYDAFYLGFSEDNNTPDADALSWLDARIRQEYAFIDQLLLQIKELRKDSEFDHFEFTTARADGYTATLTTVYNQARLFSVGNKMLTFQGQDGGKDHICQSIGGTCVRLKGQRHRASWWVSHNLVPYRGNPNYDCGGWNCQHYLADDNGKRFTL